MLAILILLGTSLFVACGSQNTQVSTTSPTGVSLYFSPVSLSLSPMTQCSDAPTIAAGLNHSVGLKEDKTVVAVGSNSYGQLNVSPWSDIKAVAAGWYHTVGVKEDGTVVAVGYNGFGQLNVSSWSGIKAVAAGALHTVGLKEDGTVVAVGYNSYGLLNVSSWSGIKAIAAGTYHTVGLKEDGTIVAVGYNGDGELNFSSWKNIQAIAAAADHSLGLKADGTVAAAGYDGYGELNVSSWKNIQAISAGAEHTLGLKTDGTVTAVGSNDSGQLNVSTWQNLMSVCVPDGTAPVTTAVITGTAGNNGWYVSDVQMTLTATDEAGGSGVKAILYSIDGAASAVQGDSASYTITTDGKHVVTYYAIDNAGNAETPHTMNINIDKTSPTIHLLSADPSVLWPSNHKMIDVVIRGSATAGASGIASTTITVTDEYGICNTSVAGFNSTVKLESWRAGTDLDGRLYTITAVVTNNAGKQSTGTTTVLVPHDMR